MCCQKVFLKQNDILWDCIATSLKTAQYLVYSQLMESCFNSFDFLSFLTWCTELILHHGKCNNYLHMLQHCHRKLEWTKFSFCCMHACLESNALLIFVVTNLKKIAATYQSLIRPTWTGTKKWFDNCQCTFVFNTDAVAKESGCRPQMYLGVLLLWSLLIAHWLHPYPQNSSKVQELVLYTSCKIQTLSLTWHPEGPRAGLSPAIQAAIQTLNISGMTPAIWNLPPPGIWIWIWNLPPTRNLNLNCFLNKEFQLQRQTGFQ